MISEIDRKSKVDISKKRLFMLDYGESSKLQVFVKNHLECCVDSATPEFFTVGFYFDSVAMFPYVRCVCGVVENLTSDARLDNI